MHLDGDPSTKPQKNSIQQPETHYRRSLRSLISTELGVLPSALQLDSLLLSSFLLHLETWEALLRGLVTCLQLQLRSELEVPKACASLSESLWPRCRPLSVSWISAQGVGRLVSLYRPWIDPTSLINKKKRSTATSAACPPHPKQRTRTWVAFSKSCAALMRSLFRRLSSCKEGRCRGHTLHPRLSSVPGRTPTTTCCLFQMNCSSGAVSCSNSTSCFGPGTPSFSCAAHVGGWILETL